MDIDELLRAGSDICDDVVHAINTNNYSDLGKKITDRVNEVTGQFMASGSRPGAAGPSGRPGAAGGGQYRPNGPMQSYAAQGSNSHWNRDLSRRMSSFFLKHRVSKATGVGKMVTGIVGTAFNGLLTLGATVAAAAGTLSFWPIGIFGALTAASIVLIVKGSKDKALVDKYYKYGRELGQSEFFSVDKLADSMGISEKELHDEIEQMMKKGYLPQAKFDRGETTVMLSERAYAQYMQAEEGRLQREAEENARREEEKKREERLGSTELGRDAAEVLRQGNAYLQRVRELNAAIPDEEMSGKLYRLEDIMNRIFEQVEKQPETAQSLRRFMEYYLPTTEKLLKAYVDLEKQPEVGENITKPKQQIEEAMDTINDAFEKLLDSLFEDMAWDVSSDINVMRTMMAQDGLTEESGGFAAMAQPSEGTGGFATMEQP